ncbi:MAG: photosystem II protein Psb27 [Cyanobacteria bacterium P01_F01_bin.143]
MFFKNFLSRILSLVLVVVIGLMGCSSTSVEGFTGDYSHDTMEVITNIRTSFDLPDNSEEKRELIELIRAQVGDYAARYRRDSKTGGLRSFTTMQTALNALAGYYSSYGIRPLPQALQKRLEIQFGRVEFSLYRGI